MVRDETGCWGEIIGWDETSCLGEMGIWGEMDGWGEKGWLG